MSDLAPAMSPPPVPLPLEPARESEPMSTKFSALVATLTGRLAPEGVASGIFVTRPVK